MDWQQQSFDFDIGKAGDLGRVEVINLPDAELIFFPRIFDFKKSSSLFQFLRANIIWRQDTLTYYGNKLALPRLTAWYGERGKNYTYSGIDMSPQAWTSELLTIKNAVERTSDAAFNSVLLNLYRSGKDSVSWHQDNEHELGVNPVIASLSLGQSRKFQFRHKFRNDLDKFEIELTDGSLLVMKGETQTFWQHQIPKTSKDVGERINLTFRYIYS